MLTVKRLQRAAHKIFKWREYRYVRKASLPSLSNALARWSHREVNTVIDIGASNGAWSKMAMRHFPRADYLLIEAQAGPHEAGLRQFKEEHPCVEYLLAAAGNRQGTIHFDATEPLGGLASDTPFASNNIEVPVTTVDAEVRSRGLKPPFLLKLDTHGFEVPIFEGAVETLKQTSLLIVEAYNFQLTGGSLRFPGLCAYLEERGFRCADLFDILHRPADNALWQFDLAFVPEDALDYSSNHYQ